MADLSLTPEAAWREAQCRAEVVRPLVERGRRPRHLVQAAAASLGLSERQTYTLLRRCREADGALTALLPGRSGSGRGRTRLEVGSEAMVRRVVEASYLTSQKRSAAWVVGEVLGRCRQAGVAPPSPAPFGAASRRWRWPTCAGVARSTPKRSLSTATHRPPGARSTWCRSTTRRWT